MAPSTLIKVLTSWWLAFPGELNLTQIVNVKVIPCMLGLCQGWLQEWLFNVNELNELQARLQQQGHQLIKQDSDAMHPSMQRDKG